MTLNNKAFHPLRLLGLGFFSVALAIVLVAGWPIVQAEAGWQLRKIRKIRFVVEPKDVIEKGQKGFDEVSREADTEILSPVDRDFGLVIPKIGLNNKVFAEIDMGGEDNYKEVLSEGAAHALGSSFPGQKGTVYIFAHSADFSLTSWDVNPIFSLLGKLEIGDEVDIFYNDWRYTYIVSEVEVVSGDETDYLTGSGEEKLILQTCWPLGTRWKRLVVTAKPVRLVMK